MAGSGASLAPRLTKSGSAADGWLQYYNQMAHRLVQGDLLITKMLSDCTTALSVARDTMMQGKSGGSVGGVGGDVAEGAGLTLEVLFGVWDW